jgi:hypothetical protein
MVLEVKLPHDFTLFLFNLGKKSNRIQVAFKVERFYPE